MPHALAHFGLMALLWLGLGWATNGRAQSAPLQPGEYECVDEFNIGTGLLVVVAR